MGVSGTTGTTGTHERRDWDRLNGRLAGYDDTNDAVRLSQDPAMRVIVGWQGSERKGASTSEMGRFETEFLTQEDNLKGLARINTQWVAYPTPASNPGYGQFRFIPFFPAVGNGQLSVVLSSFRSFAIILFLLFQFVETRPVFTMPRPEVSRSLRVNYLPGFPDLSP